MERDSLIGLIPTLKFIDSFGLFLSLNYENCNSNSKFYNNTQEYKII